MNFTKDFEREFPKGFSNDLTKHFSKDFNNTCRSLRATRGRASARCEPICKIYGENEEKYGFGSVARDARGREVASEISGGN